MYCTWYLYAHTSAWPRTDARLPRCWCTSGATGSSGERGRSRANRTEPLEAGCRAPRQMRRRVSIASVLQRNWSVICVRAGPVVTLLLSPPVDSVPLSSTTGSVFVPSSHRRNIAIPLASTRRIEDASPFRFSFCLANQHVTRSSISLELDIYIYAYMYIRTFESR